MHKILNIFADKSRLDRIVGFSIERNFYRAPEFFNDHRDSPSFANNSWEDDQTLDIMRTVLNMAAKPIGCQRHSNEVIDDFETRYKLGLSYELPKFLIKALKVDSDGKLQAIHIGTLSIILLFYIMCFFHYIPRFVFDS